MRKPFELCRAPKTFLRSIEDSLLKVGWQFTLVYLDGKAAFNKAQKQHIKLMCEVLSLLNSVSTTLKLKRCSYLYSTVAHLKQLIRPRRLVLAAHTTTRLRSLEAPNSITELRSFSGLCTVFWKVVSS